MCGPATWTQLPSSSPLPQNKSCLTYSQVTNGMWMLKTAVEPFALSSCSCENASSALCNKSGKTVFSAEENRWVSLLHPVSGPGVTVRADCGLMAVVSGLCYSVWGRGTSGTGLHGHRVPIKLTSLPLNLHGLDLALQWSLCSHSFLLHY